MVCRDRQTAFLPGLKAGVSCLYEDEGLRFNQIRDLFEAEPPEIARALKALANACLLYTSPSPRDS